MNENGTIIIVQDQEELTQCQLQYLLEGQYFGERVCSQWARDNYCLRLKPSTVRQKIIHKDREITSLVREKIKREKELRLEKIRLYNITERNKVQERRTNEYVRQLENIILDHKRENYRLCCEHLLNETQKQIELFIEKEAMFNNFRHVQYLFDELQRQYMTFVDSLLLENKNLRTDIDRIDANYCHQLGNLRSVNNEVNGLMAVQVRNERNRLNDERSRLLRSQSREVRVYDGSVVAERNLNVKLNGELLRLQEEIREKDERVKEELCNKAKETQNRITISNALSELKMDNEKLVVKLNRTQFQFENVLISVQKTNVRLQSVTTRLKNDKHHVNDVSSKLRSYVRTIAEAFSSLKSKNNELTALNSNRYVQFRDDFETGRIARVKLQDEITHLKNEKRRVSDTLKHLEEYLPTIAKVFLELKLTNENLTTANTVNASQMVQLENVLATEQRTNVKLRDEVCCLKNEKNRIDDRWRLEVKKRVAETKHEMTRASNVELNGLTKTIEMSVKREQRLIEMLGEKSSKSSRSAQLLERNGRSRPAVDGSGCRSAARQNAVVAGSAETNDTRTGPASSRSTAANKCSGDHHAESGQRRRRRRRRRMDDADGRRCGALPRHVVERLVDELASKVEGVRENRQSENR